MFSMTFSYLLTVLQAKYVTSVKKNKSWSHDAFSDYFAFFVLFVVSC